MLARVAARLTERGVPFRLIGGSALAAYGVSRSTRDVDLLVRDLRVLDETFWLGVAGPGETLEVRRGDPTDPLVGVIRLTEDIPDDADWSFTPAAVDVVFPVGRWVDAMLTSMGAPSVLDGVALTAVDACDLILLKLYGGGPRDAWDIDALLTAARDRAALEAAVDARIDELPKRCGRFWHKVRSAR
jgi:hypothetical protein